MKTINTFLVALVATAISTLTLSEHHEKGEVMEAAHDAMEEMEPAQDVMEEMEAAQEAVEEVEVEVEDPVDNITEKKSKLIDQ